jgi:hypothetical protein
LLSAFSRGIKAGFESVYLFDSLLEIHRDSEIVSNGVIADIEMP